MSLFDLSLKRAELPRFPGDTLPEQLAAGRRAAFDILRLYKPELRFDPQGADANLRVVQTWAERNSADLEAALADPHAETLPERIRLAFDAKTAQDFVIASFTVAASGLGPWMSGAIEQNVSEQWAREDAAARLQTFGSIVSMHESGYLKSVFEPAVPAAGQNELVITAGMVAIVVAGIVAIAAIVVIGVYSMTKTYANNKLMRSLCEKAQESGDKKTVEACIEATKGLQTDDPLGVKSIASTLLIGALVVGGVWAAFTYGPALLAKRRAS